MPLNNFEAVKAFLPKSTILTAFTAIAAFAAELQGTRMDAKSKNVISVNDTVLI